jgi:hypothetical protein
LAISASRLQAATLRTKTAVRAADMPAGPRMGASPSDSDAIALVCRKQRR